MAETDPSGTPWSDEEIDLIVADYFEMRQMELSQTHFFKSHRNAALRQLIRRSKSSIEFKHRNISAVLRKLGMSWITGYFPAENHQDALIAGVERFIEVKGELTLSSISAPGGGLADETSLFFEPAPVQILEERAVPPALNRLVRKFDPAARDARNRALGKLGEEKVFNAERSRLIGHGREDLADQVKWVSEDEGDGAGFDILSFSETGKERLLEVKTTTGYQLTPFYLSDNERRLSVERPDAFHLVRLYDFARTPKAFELRPPLEESVMLRPINYRASFT